MEKQLIKKDQALHLSKDYKNFLIEVKGRLKTAQISAALAANKELIRFYWQLGKDLLDKQKDYKWGDGFLEQFSNDMHHAFPEMQGFSIRNLQRMKQFYTLYPNFPITAQAVPQLPWGHIVRLMQMVKSAPQREWYAEQTVKNGWSRSVLEMQIESGLYDRQCKNKKLTNYQETLTSLQSDLDNDLFKDPYHFDFLTIQGKAHEKAIEDALIKHVRDFLLELGKGFAFVGSQVPLIFDDQEFFVDLLFYHIDLRAFIVIELKATKFKPEHMGQLSFYLAAIDDQLKREGDNQAIGILLCKSKNKLVAEYALRDTKAPIGVSEYTLSKALPEKLKTKLPSIEEIETGLNE